MPQARNSERPRGSRGTLSRVFGLLSLGLALFAPPAPTRSPTPPRRVVALAPSAAEILFSLEAASRVVGVPDFVDDLPEAAGRTRVGGFAPDLERVVSLAPDLVVVSKDGTDRAAYEKLGALGMTVVVTNGTTLAGVLEDVTRVGHALGEDERARALVQGLAKRIAAAEALGRARPHRRALALIWPDPPVAAGARTFVGDVVRRAGFTNVVPESAGDWPRVSFETLAAWNPDLVIRPESPENAGAFAQAFRDPRWRLVKAVNAGRVVVVPGSLLERPGPRLVEALERLAAVNVP
ncbi:MAG TPA: helical backbone metal receptor [Thermoanaerobaculia bacterium]|nr:helical backbone metal receptor [Thermoanaerobaculia bacterium]